jgi:hypothetical protein
MKYTLSDHTKAVSRILMKTLMGLIAVSSVIWGPYYIGKYITSFTGATPPASTCPSVFYWAGGVNIIIFVLFTFAAGIKHYIWIVGKIAQERGEDS